MLIQSENEILLDKCANKFELLWIAFLLLLFVAQWLFFLLFVM